MSVNVEAIFSEAPPERAMEFRRLFASLKLLDVRLSPERLEEITKIVAARPELYEDLVVDDPDNRWWLQLYLADNFEVRVLSWERDQSSDWHDHGGSSGGWTVTSGSLFEQYAADDHVSVLNRRLEAGEHGSFGPSHIHDVIYVSGEPAVSIHAYSPPLVRLTTYDRTRFGFVARDFVEEEQRFARGATH